MYTHHPLDVDDFDYDRFEAENYPILKSLIVQICDVATGSWSDDKVTQERACLLTLAVLGRVEDLGDLNEEVAANQDDEIAEDFFQKAVITCMCSHLEDAGSMERCDGGWRLTAFGEAQAKRITQRRGDSDPLLALIDESIARDSETV